MIISYLEIYSLLLGSIGTLIVLKFWENYIRIGYDSKQKIQKLHTNISYRIGGITSIFFIVVLSFFGNFSYSLQIILLVFIPLISVSVIEDLFQNVAIKVRFLFMFITSVLLVYLTDSYFKDTGIEFLNLIFSNIFLSILITSFGVLVTCNAWNFIDGVNGLSSGLGAFVLLCLSFLSTDIDVAGFREFLRLSAFVFFGFFLINIITGRVFLGDTGSYFLGTLIGWSGVLIANHSDISPWAIFLIIIYPASDIIFSVVRRIYSKKSPFLSDNLHLHSLLFSILDVKYKLNYTNSFTGLMILSLGVAPGLLCLIIDYKYPLVLYASFIFFSIYVIFYFILSIILQKLSARSKK